jgi:hypothetical protein
MILRPWNCPSSPWRTTEECARFLGRFTAAGEPDRKHTREFLDTQPVRKGHAGRNALYMREDVERLVVIDEGAARRVSAQYGRRGRTSLFC